jgi:hypothetical protein
MMLVGGYTQIARSAQGNGGDSLTMKANEDQQQAVDALGAQILDALRIIAEAAQRLLSSPRTGISTTVLAHPSILWSGQTRQ